MNLLLKLAAAFPQPPIDRATLAVYAEALAGTEPECLNWAVSEAIRTCQHFPRVRELLELTKKRKIQLQQAETARQQRLALAEPKNPAPPSLVKLLGEQKQRGGAPRRLL